MDKKKFKETALGGLTQNPVFVMVLGICPMLAASRNLADAFALGMATFFALVLSCVVISLLRKFIPEQVRITVNIVVIATLVTVIILLVKSYVPTVYENVGSYLALVAVNCIIMGRVEVFASKNKVGYALVDSISMGVGFVVAISLVGWVRELLTKAGFNIFGTLAGGFIVLGLMLAGFNALYGMYNDSKKRTQDTIDKLQKQVALLTEQNNQLKNATSDKAVEV